jgi:hypothetical protein
VLSVNTPRHVGKLTCYWAAADRQRIADSPGTGAVTCGRTILNRTGQNGLKAERVVKQNGKRPAFRQRGNPSRPRSGSAINHLQAWSGHGEVIVLGESRAATLFQAERATAFREMQPELTGGYKMDIRRTRVGSLLMIGIGLIATLAVAGFLAGQQAAGQRVRADVGWDFISLGSR